MDEFTEAFGDWLTDEVHLHVLEGAGFEGEEWAPSVPVGQVLVENKRRQVRTATGAITTSEATLYVAPGQPAFHPGDRVVLPTGRVATVLAAVDNEVPGLFAHTVVNLE